MKRLVAAVLFIGLLFAPVPAQAQAVVQDDRQASAEFRQSDRCTTTTVSVNVSHTTTTATPDDRFAAIGLQRYVKTNAPPGCPTGDPIIDDLSATVESFDRFAFHPEARTAAISGTTDFYDNHSGLTRTLDFAFTWQATAFHRRTEGNTTTWNNRAQSCGTLLENQATFWRNCTNQARLTRTLTVS